MSKMRAKVDQDILCEFCGKVGGSSPESMCEGLWCEEERSKYLDEHGIIEKEGVDKSFENVTIGDVFFELTDKITPGIVRRKINNLHRMNKGDLLTIGYESTTFTVHARDVKLTSVDVFFLDEKDAKAALVELCSKRITALALIMGKAS